MFTLLATFIASLTTIAGNTSYRRGAICFTFDDYFGNEWLKANVLFKKYDAHATFFIVGDITEEKAQVIKKLQALGHTVGLHTKSHRNATELSSNYDMGKYVTEQVLSQLEACKKYGIKVSSFAYPNNRYDENTNKVLFKYFDYLRAGWGKDKQPIYIPLDKIQEKMVLPGGGIGKYYKSDINNLKKLLLNAHKKDALIVFFSHNITPQASHVHMPTEMLEELLKYARKLNMNIVGAQELLLLKQNRNNK
jgi:peptidoglycan/xylan/chitin deacetylase (PgdA/CDA1 family)